VVRVKEDEGFSTAGILCKLCALLLRTASALCKAGLLLLGNLGHIHRRLLPECARTHLLGCKLTRTALDVHHESYEPSVGS
jgi:hypothetical protein